jgi:NTE family protein
VDGGVCSASNLDLLAGRGLDLVICLNPLTSAGGRPSGLAAGALDLIPSLARRAGRGRLEREQAKVRRYGTEVVVIEPTSEDHEAMGHNWMSVERRQHVIEVAERTVAEQLQKAGVRARLEDLPKGEPHKLRQPAGPPSGWPELLPPARRAA